tara:strand:+ start:4998 stop:5432 length:435 start_codon:yes stop_codon:yes gene_type:complete
MDFFKNIFKNYESINKINYENIQEIIKNNTSDCYLINTMSNETQNVIIPNTIQYNNEEELINNLISKSKFDCKIIIYGKNCNDETIYKKYLQLKQYGFIRLYIYVGGIFEWLLLQDIYGKDLFPTNGFTLDILKYKSCKYNIKN